MRSFESLFNDSQWEIRIPNAHIESLHEDYKAVTQAKPRTHVFYDETVLFFLQISLPEDLSTLHEETASQVEDFFQALEIQVEAAYVDPLSLVASGAAGQNALYKSPNGSRPASGQQHADRRLSTSSPGFGARPGYNDQGRIESTMMYTYAYNPADPGKKVEIRPINGLWTAIFPFSVPVSFMATKSANPMLMLSAHVLFRPADQVVPVSTPMDDQYNLECFSMVNLLEGLSDDPTFAMAVVPQHHYRPDTPRARTQQPMAPVLRRSVRRTIAARSALNVRMRTTRVSPTENPVMMSIEVENNSEHGAKFKTTQLNVEVTHAVVTPLGSPELTKLPMVLNSSDHVTFLYSISFLDNPEWQPESPLLGNAPFEPHSRHSSENLARSGSSRDAQRKVTIFLEGIPEVDGVQGQMIHSHWNCFLDITDLRTNDNMPGAASVSSSGPAQKQLYAPQPSHPSGLLPSQHSTSGTPTNPQGHHQHQLHHRNRSLPSSPQPPQGLQRNTSLARRVSNGSSPRVDNNRPSTGPNNVGESRARRSSVNSDGAPSAQQQRSAALSSAGRKSGLGGWGYGRSNNDSSQGLAPVQEGSSYLSPMVVAESEAGGHDEESSQGGVHSQSGRPAVNGALSPGLGLDLANQALTGVTQGRTDQDSGDGIVVSFAVTDRVVVGKIFNLEIFIVNRSRHIRRYTLVVPNRKRAKGGDPSQGSKVLPPLPSGERAVVQNVPIDPYMEEPELLRRHVDNETTEADIICLENNIRLSPLYPLTCQNLNLRFIAIKEQLHTIDLVQLVDNDTGFVTNLRNCLCFMAEASFGALSQQVPEVRK
ncbi:TRAPP trafficking subunit Trs65-domain-containing protein [Gamsiella multidivaricata]|uniref:TRAPP trafficking subunit Trs65-domain-containing protein n=1 Tax=Gamsiella multidivaricata TaxID=101098 RepID=UPI00221F471C|nr:TRAPP trafficking subunit Trs65-domain-containing protein [Gamsiella multidivaricata]KAI7826947.1 TRAPP trafficking subunit Trs65-domain-containing protein [Gamsiella multidivaricata]